MKKLFVLFVVVVMAIMVVSVSSFAGGEYRGNIRKHYAPRPNRNYSGQHKHYAPRPRHYGGHHNEKVIMGLLGAAVIIGTVDALTQTQPPQQVIVYPPPPPRMCIRQMPGEWVFDRYGREVWISPRNMQVPCY